MTQERYLELEKKMWSICNFLDATLHDTSGSGFGSDCDGAWRNIKDNAQRYYEEARETVIILGLAGVELMPDLEDE